MKSFIPCSFLCTKAAQNQEAAIGSLSDPNVSFYFYDQIEAVPDDYWEIGLRSGDYFLQRDYLQFLEDHPPHKLRFVYWLFYLEDRPVGIAYGQILEFRADEHIHQQEGRIHFFQQWLARQIQLNVLVCGNSLQTGQHAFYFLPDYEYLSGASLREALELSADHCRRNGLAITTILLKDLEAEELGYMPNWRKSDFHQLDFQPNMVLPVPAHWQNLDDYLGDLSSKYRVRYRRARKKLRGVQRRELDESQIRTFEGEIYRLYRKVAEGSNFCVSYLPEDYFSALKAQNPHGFRLWVYTRNKELLGFYTTLRNGHELEAHFLGLDDDQQEFQLYLNMLYDLIDEAINARVDRLIFSRTAMEIKSSVGAVPVPTSVFLLQHSSRLLNHLIPQLVNWLEPKEHWQPRHPFREGRALVF